MGPNTRIPAWYPSWRGETVVLVGSGPSAIDIPLELGIGRARFVGINTSWRLCPWADVLYACDYQWWLHYGGCPEFKGPLRVCVSPQILNRPEWKVNYLECAKPDDRMLLDRPGIVGWGGNSGFNALNFVAQLKPEKIILVGYDMCKHWGAHWHSPHPQGMSNPTFATIKRWLRVTDGAAGVLSTAGITVVNCSPISALSAYPKMSFAEALDYRNGDAFTPLASPAEPARLMPNPLPAAEAELLDPIESVRTMLELGNKKNTIGTYKAYFRNLGIEHVSVDLNGSDGALPLDLQKPLGLGRRFDCVTNFGTSEHVDNQTECWRNIAEHAADVVVSTTPMPGGKDWSWHGRWYPLPEFYQAFAKQNGFDLERFYVSGQAPRRMLFARLKRKSEPPFKMPPLGLIYRNGAGKKVGAYG